MKLIVGLGNPGKKFQKTRHNTGHLFIDSTVKQKGVKSLPAKFVKTTIFMNDSGKEVKSLITNYFASAKDERAKRVVTNYPNLLIVHDDMDLPLGEFKLQFERSAAGHKGVQSIIDALGTKDFWRLRIGIGNPPPGVNGDDFVLEEFSREEFGLLRKAFAEASFRILEWAALDRGGVGG